MMLEKLLLTSRRDLFMKKKLFVSRKFYMFHISVTKKYLISVNFFATKTNTIIEYVCIKILLLSISIRLANKILSSRRLV